MDNFIEWITNNWQTVADAVFELFTAIGGIILLFQRTGTKRINRKIDEHVVKDNINYDLSNYDAIIDGKKVNLEKLKVKKRS